MPEVVEEFISHGNEVARADEDQTPGGIISFLKPNVQFTESSAKHLALDMQLQTGFGTCFRIKAFMCSFLRLDCLCRCRTVQALAALVDLPDIARCQDIVDIGRCAGGRMVSEA